MTTPRERLEGFLARVHDVARGGQAGATEDEAQGAVRELVRRLRLLHQAGEGDLWLMLLTTEEKKKLLAYRARVGGPSPEEEPPPGRSARKAAQEGQGPSTREVVQKAVKVTAVLDEIGFFDMFDRPAKKKKPVSTPVPDEDGEDGL